MNIHKIIDDIRHAHGVANSEQLDALRALAASSNLNASSLARQTLKDLGRPVGIQTTVITVSRNANAFGYRSVLCLAPCGRGFEVLKQAYGTDKLPVPGEALVVEFPGYCTRELRSVDPKSAAKVIADAKRTLV